MSSLAQKLCDEIVVPSVDESSQILPSRTESIQCPNRTKKQNAKVSKTFTVEKRKVVQKVVPPSSSRSSKAAINKLISKEILTKKRFRDTSVNTFSSKPYRCDNDSITMVRRKDYRKNCNCIAKHPFNMKETQTYNRTDFTCIDKACDQSILTLSRSTQFTAGLSGVKCIGISTSTGFNNLLSISQETPRVRMAPSSRTNSREYSRTDWGLSNNVIHKKYSNSNYMGARRWALSRYPTKGPDF